MPEDAMEQASTLRRSGATKRHPPNPAAPPHRMPPPAPRGEEQVRSATLEFASQQCRRTQRTPTNAPGLCREDGEQDVPSKPEPTRRATPANHASERNLAAMASGERNPLTMASTPR